MKSRILVCDDDRDIGEVLSIILLRSGYDVKVINDGQSIEMEIKNYNPDLLLLDIMMPGIDGKEITRTLKAEKKTQSLPIILVSALNNPMQIAMEAGADNYISKPFDMKTLLQQIKDLLKK